MNSSQALIDISDHILNSINNLNQLEYNKNGRKYKFIDNGFQRIIQEDKHLIVNPNDLSMKASIISSYSILNSIDGGRLIRQYEEFCLCIIGVARELELNKWYENSNVVDYANNKFSPELVKSSINFGHKVNSNHLTIGYNLLVASKLNFFHTDHHLGSKLYGFYFIKFIKQYFGEDIMNDNGILIALKSFVHWGSIRLILYKLDVPNVYISDEEYLRFTLFPDPSPELKHEIFVKYPSGTSKFNIIKKCLLHLRQYKFSKIIEFPKDSKYDLEWIFKLCKDIESDPIKYHLRSNSKKLTQNPVNLSDVANTFNSEIVHTFNYIAIVFNIFNLQIENITKLTRIPAFDSINEPDLISKYQDTYDKIQFYTIKKWNNDDIILRLNCSHSLFHKVDELQKKYSLNEY